ncbi:MAG TPA: CopD family protein, partial [Chloroflexota bacterium]|nr:CopD family protein [Chloroflexota bacterium]
MTARRLLALLAVALVAILAVPGQVHAHAHLIQADLAPDADLRAPSGTVHFWFDEGLNGGLSKILIRDAQGAQVNSDTGRVNPTNSEELDVRIPALAPGQYTVFWTSDSSSDGHILHGFYLFTVGGTGARAISTTPSTFVSPETPALDTTSLSSALAHWLVLLSSTVWTGALALELLVLLPARARAGARKAEVATRASARLRSVIGLGLIATLLALLGELGTQAYAAGGWSGLTNGAVLGDMLSSHYGIYWIARMLLVVLTLLVVGAIPDYTPGVLMTRRARLPARPMGVALLAISGALGLAYLLAFALSGHAAAVSQLIFTSVGLDWLHLLANSVWIGGMAAIALAIVPTLRIPQSGGERDAAAGNLAVLDLLDRFSPLAYLALATAAVTGEFNAQVHLSSLDQLINTAYGRFLLIKLILIVEIMALSASHVFLTRPRLRAMAVAGEERSADAYASLVLRLRVEPLIGGLILLCVALMGQVAPAVTVFSQPKPSTAASSATPAAPVAQAITGAAHAGTLAVTLTIDPAAVGKARFFATVREKGRPVTDGQVRIRLSVRAQSSLGYVFVETTPQSGGYQGYGDLVQTGGWQADVLVRTRDDPLEYRAVPFTFLVGADAVFLDVQPINTRYGPATVSLTQPSNAPAILTVRLRPGLQVRYEVAMPVMPGMGAADYPAKAVGGVYSGLISFPMAGLVHVAIEVEDGGAWKVARLLLYEVDATGVARLLTTDAPATPTPAASVAPASLNVPFALHLPYTALVTRMKDNTVARLNGQAVSTGKMPHGVDFVDGTSLVYVTDFLQGDVVVLDIHTLKVLHRIPVGLEPTHVVFTPSHRLAFVTNFLTNDVSVIDMRTYKVVGDIQVGLRPHGMDISPDGRWIYVACEGEGAIYVIDTHTLKVKTEAPAGLEPLGVTVNPVNGEVYVTDARGNQVYILRAGSLNQRAVIPVGNGPALMAVTSDGSRLYVANQLGNSLSVIATKSATVLATVPVGNAPHGPDITPDGKYVFVPAINAGTITIIRTADNQVV